MNARIGYPNEHLAPGHFEELKKPQYATCIGLILKGYNVHENTQNSLLPHMNEEIILEKIPKEEVEVLVEQANNPDPIPQIKRPRKLGEFLNSFRNGIINIFEPETDSKIN
jgi:cell division protein FtsA